jgi:hypothetical protein
MGSDFFIVVTEEDGDVRKKEGDERWGEIMIWGMFGMFGNSEN